MRSQIPHWVTVGLISFLRTCVRLIAFSNKIVFFFAIYGEEAEKERPALIFFLTYKLLLRLLFSLNKKHSCFGTIIVPITRVSFICLLIRYSTVFLRNFLRFSYEAIPFNFFQIFLSLNSFENI